MPSMNKTTDETETVKKPRVRKVATKTETVDTPAEKPATKRRTKAQIAADAAEALEKATKIALEMGLPTPEAIAAKAGATLPRKKLNPEEMSKDIYTQLEDAKAEDLKTIDLRGKTSLADHIVIASGRSSRHVASLANNLVVHLKAMRLKYLKIEGLPQADWVIVDTGDVVVHLFRPEVREYYHIEEIWEKNPEAAAMRRQNAGENPAIDMRGLSGFENEME